MPKAWALMGSHDEGSNPYGPSGLEVNGPKSS